MKVLITGGAGFIGTNAAKEFITKGEEIIIIDNLSRRGVEKNLEYLNTFGKFTFIKCDIRDKEVKEVFEKYRPDVVLHFAAQVGVVSSVLNPKEDFEINVIGTFNLLEAARKYNAKFIFSSTNKVYGQMNCVEVIEKEKRYEYKYIKGINEDVRVNLRTPYGCSKGAADLYVIDYAKTYELQTAVLRLSCIYGERQFGMEEQGWLAWLTIASLFDKEIIIYGNGKQLRDALYISDLVNLIKILINKDLKGDVYNIGGGPENTISLLELIDFLQEKLKKKIKYKFDKMRIGDQLVYISNIDKAKKELEWQPKVSIKEGLNLLFDWVVKNKEELKCLVK